MNDAPGGVLLLKVTLGFCSPEQIISDWRAAAGAGCTLIWNVMESPSQLVVLGVTVMFAVLMDCVLLRA